MKNAVTRFLIYTSIVLVWICTVMIVLDDLKIISHPYDPNVGVGIMAIVVMLFITCLINVIISLLLLISMLWQFKKTRTFSRSIPLVHLLYFIPVFIISYLSMEKFRVTELKSVGDYHSFNLNYSLACHSDFFSNTYLLLKLGVYKISLVYNSLVHSEEGFEQNDNWQTLAMCANALLSGFILIISTSVVAYKRWNKSDKTPVALG